MVSARTRLLNGPELRAELLNARDFFLGEGCADVRLAYDTGFRIHAPRVIPVAHLLIAIEESIAAGTIELGTDVISIQDLDGRNYYRFGRDSNVSMVSSDPELVAERIRLWTAAGLKGDWANAEGERRPWGPVGAEPDSFSQERERLRSDAGQPQHQRFGTRRLSEGEFAAEGAALVRLLQKYGIQTVNIECLDLAGEEGGSPGRLTRSVSVADIVDHIRNATASGTYRYGVDLITVSDPQGEFELDIRKTLQIVVRNRVFMEEIRALWTERGLQPR